MATAADWEDRFAEFVRLSPHDVRGIWTLIAECLEDNDELSHTFNAVLKAHGAPHNGYEDLRQDLALRLTKCIRTYPDLNLHERWHGVTAAGWFYRVIGKLCLSALRARWAKHRRQMRLQAVLADGRLATLADGCVESSDELFEVARVAQASRENASDAAMDVNGALAECDPRAAAAIRAYVKDWHFQSVADEFGCSYKRAWRVVHDGLVELREPLRAYREHSVSKPPL